MRTFIILTFLLTQFYFCYSQPNFEGKYRDYFGYSIELKNDLTFEFNYQFDLASGWAVGTWSKDGNVVNLKVTPILDTLTRTSQSDSLVLSMNMKSERISEEQFAVSRISSGGQLPTYAPTKLLFRKERLYTFDKNGKLMKRKVRGLFTKKKYDPWYFRINE